MVELNDCHLTQLIPNTPELCYFWGKREREKAREREREKKRERERERERERDKEKAYDLKHVNLFLDAPGCHRQAVGPSVHNAFSQMTARRIICRVFGLVRIKFSQLMQERALLISHLFTAWSTQSSSGKNLERLSRLAGIAASICK